MIAPRVPAIYILLALGLATLYVFYTNSARYAVDPEALTFASTTPANTTLGFGALYVVSGPGSKRREGMIEASNVTEIDLVFPKLPAWSDEQVHHFYEDEGGRSTITHGSVKAWLSHHVVLRKFLKSGLETALIFEDDVDWDISLRSTQIPSTAAALRSILPKAAKEYFWGHPNDWDLLYLGHCGDYFGPVTSGHVGVGLVHPEDLDKVPHALFHDNTIPNRTDLHPFSASLLTAFSIPEKTRIVHKSNFPLCSFGYAVTRASALAMVEQLAPPKEHPQKFLHAYDIAILEACRYNLTCFTVSPELFHHMEGESMIDGKPRDEMGKPPADRVGTAQVHWRNETSNIRCGFWSKDFRFNKDEERLDFLREEVGRKGRCLKPGRDEDGARSKAVSKVDAVRPDDKSDGDGPR